MRDRLRERLAAMANVQPSWIVLANGIDELHAMILAWRAPQGPIVMFPPEDAALTAWVSDHADQVEQLPRLNGFRLPVIEGAYALPAGATAIVMSPNDPSGRIMTVQELVVLLRRCAYVVVDERHAAYSSRSLVPVIAEWDNAILLQTFETFAGMTSLPMAWAIAPPDAARQIERYARPSGMSRMALIAAHAILDNRDLVARSVRQITREKGHLFRQLRKLNMVSVPYPSWGNFLLARFERGSADFFVPRLAERGIQVYRPPHANLRDHVRISAVSTEHTLALKAALIEIALELAPEE